MAYEQKPNTGAMFISKKRASEKSPNMYGSIHVDKVLLENLINKSKGQLVEIALSGWNNKSKSGEAYMSLAAAEPYKKQEDSSSVDSDIPEFMR